MNPDFQLGSIELAGEPDFSVGTLKVRPSLRQVEAKGESETLEPRIMQVLVALFQRRGEVVSRDELVERCWAGRIVGEDAISRAITRVRKLGESRGAFSLETIPKVGYRLIADDRTQPDLTASASPTLTARRRFPLAPIESMLVVIAIAAAGWFSYNQFMRGPLRDPSIAVLPFENLSSDSSKDYIAHGVASELIETLSQIDRLQVIGRGSSFAFKATDDPREVGKALNVANVLSGRVSQGKDALIISFELVNAGNGRTILSKTYTAAPTTDNIANAQRYMAQQVTGALSIAFDIRGGKQLLGSGTRSMEAYDFYLQGVEAMAVSPHTSEELFARAVAVDPNYGAAWGLMAIAHGSKSWLQPTPGEGRAMQDAAYAMAKKAVTLQPDVSTSQAVLANLATTQHNWSEAETASLRALDLSVNEIALGQRQFILLRSGRVTEAYALYAALEQVAPHSSTGAPKTSVLPAIGRLDELRALIESPDPAQATDSRSLLFRLQAQIDLKASPAAVRKQLEVIADLPDRNLSEFAKAVLAVFGDKKKAQRVLRTWYDGPGFESFAKYDLIPFLAAWFDDTDLVLRIWREDLPVNVVRLTQVWGPAFAPARTRPEFKGIMRDVGLVDYWRAFKWADKCRPVSPTDFECG